jgi:hypothetical protein
VPFIDSPSDEIDPLNEIPDTTPNVITPQLYVPVTGAFVMPEEVDAVPVTAPSSTWRYESHVPDDEPKLNEPDQWPLFTGGHAPAGEMPFPPTAMTVAAANNDATSADIRRVRIRTM